MIVRRDWGNINTRLEEEANSQGGQASDKRMFRPKFSKDGSFSALIRFLPAPGNEIPMVKGFAHRFKGKGGEFNEQCPTTVGERCPVCEKNREMWETDQETVKRRARQKSGIANILVISDPQNPANNGKVFLYRFGKRILDKIVNTAFPDAKLIATGAKQVNVFDYFTGANFQLNGQKVTTGGQTFPEYTTSNFLAPAPLGATATKPEGDNELMEAVEAQLYSLQEFVQKDKFKSYEDLEVLFNKALGTPNAVTSHAPAHQPSQPAPQAAPAAGAPVSQTTGTATTAAPAQTPAPAPVTEASAPAPATTGTSLDFDAVETEDEDAFWNNIKKPGAPSV